MAALSVLGCGSTSNDDPARRYAETSPEYKLASLDTEEPAPSDKMIEPYARELDLLRRRCEETRAHLAELAVTVVDRAADENVATTNFNVLRGVRKSFSNGASRGTCRKSFAAYLTGLKRTP